MKTKKETKVKPHIYQTAKGLYYVRIRLDGKCVKTSPVALLSTAQEELTSLLAQQESANQKLPITASLAKHAEDYVKRYALRGGRGGLADITVDKERETFEMIARHWPDYTVLNPLTFRSPDHVLELAKALRDGICATGGNFADGSYTKSMYAFGRLCNYLFQRALMSSHQYASVRATIKSLRLRSPARPMPACSDDFGARLIRLAQERFAKSQKRLDRDKPAMIAVLMLQGAREGALRLLHVRDINFAQRSITLYAGHKDGAELMPLNADLAGILQDHIIRECLAPGHQLFLLKDISPAMRKLAQKLGVDGWNPHCCRKFFTDQAIKAKILITVIARMLGHQDGGALLQRHYARHEHAELVSEMDKLRMVTGPTDGPVCLATAHRARLEELPGLLTALNPDLGDPVASQILALCAAIKENNFEELKKFARGEALESAKMVTKLSLSPAESVKVSFRIHYQMLLKGWNPHQLNQACALGDSTSHRLLNGESLSSPTLRAITQALGLPEGFFLRDDAPMPDFEKIRGNLDFLVLTYGLRAMPTASTLPQVLDGRNRPNGKLLQDVAERFGYQLQDLINLDIRQLPLSDKILPFVAPEQKALHIARNLEYTLLCKGLSTAAAANELEMPDYCLSNYLAQRYMPKPACILKLAKYCGLHPHKFVSTSPELSAGILGAYLGQAIHARQQTPNSAAAAMGINSTSLQASLAGQKLPNSEQLVRLARYLCTTAEELLSHALPPQLAESSGQPPSELGEVA